MQVEKIALLSSGRRGSMDVAAALAMMRDCDIGKLILLGRVNGDDKASNLLKEIIAGELRPTIGHRADHIARVICLEVIGQDHCPGCDGRTTQTKILFKAKDEIERIEVECKDCSGSGIKWRSGRERARVAGIPRRTWRDNAYCELVTAWALALEKEAGDAQKKFAAQ